MRLATARDELEPLRDPTVTGPDDPRLTVLILARVVEKLGDLDHGHAARDRGPVRRRSGVPAGLLRRDQLRQPGGVRGAAGARRRQSAPLIGVPAAGPAPAAGAGRAAGGDGRAARRRAAAADAAARGSRRSRASRSDPPMLRYPVDALWQEIAYLAYHLHWPMDELLDLEHMDRVRMVRAVAGLNERAWEAVREFA